MATEARPATTAILLMTCMLVVYEGDLKWFLLGLVGE
jgi:hypothetical protein